MLSEIAPHQIPTKSGIGGTTELNLFGADADGGGMMTKTFKALSALLAYPTQGLQAAASECRDAVLSERLLPRDVRRSLDALIGEIATSDIYDLQERYVLLFDRTRSLSLHMFEQVHGESRDRFQAVIDLKAQYGQHGLFIGAAELPDFVPLFLEYLSTLPLAEACELLGQPAHILAGLAERLRQRKSSNERVFRALVALAAIKADSASVSAVLDELDADPEDLFALDAAWEDEPVSFGPGAASSCKDSLIARIRASRRPAPSIQG
jgi:nitrate reductase molybdenum cofactor assembly chaperone NarJ/NarW